MALPDRMQQVAAAVGRDFVVTCTPDGHWSAKCGETASSTVHTAPDDAVRSLIMQVVQKAQAEAIEAQKVLDQRDALVALQTP